MPTNPNGVTTVPLNHKDMNLLIKLCGMLGSEHDGERAAFAEKATGILRRNKMTWQELFQGMVHGAYMRAPMDAPHAQPQAAAPKPEAKPKRTVKRRAHDYVDMDTWKLWEAKILWCNDFAYVTTPWDKENLAGMKAKMDKGRSITHTQEQRLANIIDKIGKYTGRYFA